MEMDNYQDFLEVLQHHIFMGNVSTTQLTHFIMLMVYMSFCRLNHYTQYMIDKEAVLLKEAVLMTLVIMAFRTIILHEGMSQHNQSLLQKHTLRSKEKCPYYHQQIYGKGVYMYKSCIQCDIHPTLLTSQVVLPSYQHFLQHLQLTGMTKLISNESDALRQYGKTILMLILSQE